MAAPTTGEKKTSHAKRLEGIVATVELKDLLERCLSMLPSSPSPSREGNPLDQVFLGDSSTPGLGRLVTSMSWQEAAHILQQYAVCVQQDGTQGRILPLPVLRAMDIVLSSQKLAESSGHPQEETKQPDGPGLVSQTLSKSSTITLAFTSSQEGQDPAHSSASSLNPEQERFQQRLKRLQLQQEAARYRGLTANLSSMTASAVPDDITVRSMTYATSIGLNMIVAPLSFGGLMYFFAGHALDYFLVSKTDTPASTSSRAPTPSVGRVLVGVLSGVMMLFIEMILFVIRTHEMDQARRRQQQQGKQQVAGSTQGPFGPYTAATEKTYQDRHPPPRKNKQQK